MVFIQEKSEEDNMKKKNQIGLSLDDTEDIIKTTLGATIALSILGGLK